MNDRKNVRVLTLFMVCGSIKMRKFAVVAAVAIFVIAGAATIAPGGGVLHLGETNKRLDGDWKSEDSYLRRIRTTRRGKTCFSMVEAGSRTVRIVRDVVIIKGQLKHLAYYTPLTDGYVTYVNFKVTDEKMTFDWFSSYGRKSGKATYVRVEKSRPGPFKKVPPTGSPIS